MIPRSFSEHVTLLCNFGACVEALSPEAWERLCERCRPITGSGPMAMLARAKLMARATDIMYKPENAPPFIRGINGAYAGFSIGLWLTGELMNSAFPSSEGEPRRRLTTSDNPDFDRVIDVSNNVEHVLARYRVRVPGVATVVRASLQAVLRRDHLTPIDFDFVYRWVAPEIPYARVDPRATDAEGETLCGASK